MPKAWKFDKKRRKRAPGAHPGSHSHSDTKTKPKVKFSQPFLEVFVVTFCYFLRGHFCTFFWNGPLCVLGGIWVPKGPERVPKGVQK